MLNSRKTFLNNKMNNLFNFGRVFKFSAGEKNATF